MLFRSCSCVHLLSCLPAHARAFSSANMLILYDLLLTLSWSCSAWCTWCQVHDHTVQLMVSQCWYEYMYKYHLPRDEQILHLEQLFCDKKYSKPIKRNVWKQLGRNEWMAAYSALLPEPVFCGFLCQRPVVFPFKIFQFSVPMMLWTWTFQRTISLNKMATEWPCPGRPWKFCVLACPVGTFSVLRMLYCTV